MKIKLLLDTKVSFPKGTVVDVTKQEAERLLAFGLGAVEEEKKKTVKKKK